MKSIRLIKAPKWSALLLIAISIFTSFSVFSQTPPNQQNALNPTGNVGVGTMNPDSKLQVNGSMSIDSSLTARDSAIFQKQVRMKDKVIVEGEAVIKGVLTAKDNLRVLGTTKIEGALKLTGLNNTQPDDTTLLFMNAAGKVKSGGIPALLDAISSNPKAAKSLQDIVYASAQQQELCPVDNNGQPILLAPYWQTGPEKIFILNSNCKPDVRLGVGVIPEAKLHIKTSEGHSTYPIIVEKSLPGNQTQKLLQLDNNGTLFSREIKVNLINWPDFVFKKDYTLQPLSEVENYVQNNGHLPDVPSAKEIEENGLDLGEINKILMQKLEELTLHLIAQEKRITALENELINSSNTTKTTAP